MFSRAYKIVLLFIFSTAVLNAVTFSEIARLELLPLHNILSVGRANIRQNIDTQIAASFAPNFSMGNTFSFLGTGFNEDEFTDLRNRLTNRVGVSVSFNLPEIIKAYSSQNEQVNTFSSSIAEMFINITRRIYQSNSILSNIRFLKELRGAIVDFEKQITLDEKILTRETELLILYQEIVILQLQLYRSAGIIVVYDIENISFDIQTISNYLESSFLEAKN